MHRIRRRYTGSYDLTATAFDADGVEATCSAGTVTILDGGGTEIVTDAVCGISDGDLTYSLDVEDAADLDTYECRWEGVVSGDTIEWRTRFELVGDYLFELSDLRSHDGGTFASTVDYPSTRLRDARTWVEERLENHAATGVAFVPRGRRERLYGADTDSLLLSQPRLIEVYSVSVDGTALSATELAALTLGDSWISRGWDEGSVVDVHYAHGWTTPPAPVVEAGLILAREYLIAKNLSSRATSESTDVGFLRLSIAGSGGRTGVPEVDAIIADYRERPVWVG